MIKLKKILDENILLELSNNSTLYHRSLKKMKVGDIINPKTDKSGTHWLSSKPFEIVLEEYRKEKYPNRPSRLNCIYSSLVPKSRFVDKGYLYVIKPIGKMFMTDSMLIDEMEDKFLRELYNSYDTRVTSSDITKDPVRFYYYIDDFLARRYWKGEIYNVRQNIDRIEVISESAKVIEVIDENKLNIGDKILITEPNKIKVELVLYLEENDIDKYELKNDSVFNKFIEDSGKLFYGNVEPKFTKYDFGRKSGNIKFNGFLDKGIKLRIVWIESTSARPNEYGDEYEESRRKEGKYKQMKFDFYINNKLYESHKNVKQNGLPNYTMEYFNHWERDSKNKVFDISKFMKKLR